MSSTAGGAAIAQAGGTPAAGSGNPSAASGGTAGLPTAGVSAPSGSAGRGTTAASAGTAAASGGGGALTAGIGSSAGGPAAASERFSFFVTSYAAMQRLARTQNGFGGDLRYGEANGLAGADKICSEIAEGSLPGSGAKGWHAFLSVTKGPDGMPVHAIDRIGQGPWYDRRGRLLAMTRADLMSTRPKGGDAAIADDFPNEDGIPNHAPDGMMQVDNHDVLTGANDKGQLFSTDWGFTCHDWTSAVGRDGTPRVGHSWPRSGTPIQPPGAGSGGPGRPPGGFPMGGRGGFPPGGGGPQGFDGDNWMSALNEAGCAPGASLVEMGGPIKDNPTVGSGGGYGGIYCFAMMP